MTIHPVAGELLHVHRWMDMMKLSHFVQRERT